MIHDKNIALRVDVLRAHFFILRLSAAGPGNPCRSVSYSPAADPATRHQLPLVHREFKKAQMLRLLASSPMLAQQDKASREHRGSGLGSEQSGPFSTATAPLSRSVPDAAGISRVMRDAVRAAHAEKGAGAGYGAAETEARAAAEHRADEGSEAPARGNSAGGVKLPPASLMWNFGRGAGVADGSCTDRQPDAPACRRTRATSLRTKGGSDAPDLGPVETRPFVPALPFTLFPAKEKAARAASKKRKKARKYRSLRDMQRAMQPTKEDIRAAYECEQKSEEWFQFREDRITGSCFGAAAGHCPYTKPDQLLQRQLWGSFVKSRHTEHGSFYEDEARQAYILWRMLQLASLARPRESDGGAPRPLPEMLSRRKHASPGESSEPAAAAPPCPSPPALASSSGDGVDDGRSATGGDKDLPNAARGEEAALGVGSGHQEGAAAPDVPFAEELRAVRRAAHADYWFDDMPAEPLAGKPAVVEFDAPPVNAEALARLSGAEVDSREGQTSVTMDSRRKVVRVPFKCWECGIMLRRDLWYIGCSPDGLVEECGEEGCLEIKCPSSKRDFYANDKRYARTGIPPQYFDQIQGLMHFAQRAWCDFVVYVVVPNSQRRRMWVRRYMYDRRYCSQVLFPKLNAWYMKRYVPLRLAQIAGRLAEGTIKLPLRFAAGTLEAAWGSCSAWANANADASSSASTVGTGAKDDHETGADAAADTAAAAGPRQGTQSRDRGHLSTNRSGETTEERAAPVAMDAGDGPARRPPGTEAHSTASPRSSLKRPRRPALSAGPTLAHSEGLASEPVTRRRRSQSSSARPAILNFNFQDATRDTTV